MANMEPPPLNDQELNFFRLPWSNDHQASGIEQTKGSNPGRRVSLEKKVIPVYYFVLLGESICYWSHGINRKLNIKEKLELVSTQ